MHMGEVWRANEFAVFAVALVFVLVLVGSFLLTFAIVFPGAALFDVHDVDIVVDIVVDYHYLRLCFLYCHYVFPFFAAKKYCVFFR